MKGIYAERSPLYQISILVATMFVGFFFSQIINVIIFASTSADGFENIGETLFNQPVWVLQTTQFIAAVCTFLLPAVVTAWFCSNHPKTYLSIGAFPDIRILAIVCLATLLLSPTISLTSYFNSQIQLPEAMEALEIWIRETEEVAEAMIQKMVSETSVVTFIINLIVIAVVAGVTEEFLFRGALLQIIRQKIQNHHVAIWAVAIIFSAIHLQFYGFIPRMILGAFLGYLVYWTKNIWVPVFAHFFHNAIAVIGMSSASLKDNAFFTDDLASEDIKWLSIISCICLIAFVYCLKFIRRGVKSHIE